MSNPKAKYVCTSCQFIYDPFIGDPDSGVSAGTPFEDIAEDWVCPVCQACKSDFKIFEN